MTSSFYLAGVQSTTHTANRAVGKSPFSSSIPYLNQQPALNFALPFSSRFIFFIFKINRTIYKIEFQ